MLDHHPPMASVDPLQQVFDAARREFERELPPSTLFRSLLTVTTVDEVYDATDRLQLDQAAKLCHLRRIQPYLNRLQQFASAIEVFVQVKPDVLALLWGPIKLLLMLTSEWLEAFDAVVRTIERIGELLPRFSEAVVSFLDTERIKDMLGLFYRDILDFHLEVLKFFSLRRKPFAQSPLVAFDIGTFS